MAKFNQKLVLDSYMISLLPLLVLSKVGCVRWGGDMMYWAAVWTMISRVLWNGATLLSLSFDK
jgi:hypothetical protein